MRLDEDRVRDWPIMCWSMTSCSLKGAPFWNCMKLRVKLRLVGPMPSDTMKMRLRLPWLLLGALPDDELPPVFWYTTASTTTPAVATIAHTSSPISRHLFHGDSLRSVRWPVRRASSSAMSRSWNSEDVRFERRGRLIVGYRCGEGVAGQRAVLGEHRIQGLSR